MPTAKYHDGQISIPEEIREAANLQEGEDLEVEVTDEGVLLRPVRGSELDMSWFQTPEGKARIEKAVDAVRSGREWIFESGEEFVATLERLAADDADV